jgi:glycosyltransferase involved in cell wall biosynthesis
MSFWEIVGMQKNKIPSVGVLIDLLWHPNAGGQVKTWERFAEAAEAFQDKINLTLHFQGNQKKVLMISKNVRYITLPPIMSTARFRFMDHLVDHTDLSPFHISLPHYLKQYDVIHTTDAFFAYAKTALYISRLYGIPLVNSMHTDTPEGTRAYSPYIIRRLLKNGLLNGFLLDKLHLNHLLAAYLKRKLNRFQKRCDWVMVSQSNGKHKISNTLPGKKVSFLRRGIDKRCFHPSHRDRGKLEKTFGIKKDLFVLIFAGRVDRGKNVMTLARAARFLLNRGAPIHVMIAGEGRQKQDIKDLLGPAVTFTGIVSQANLSWLYASADTLVFPSVIEICPNVVIEAKSSGLPVLVPSKGGASALVKRDGEDGMLMDDNSPRAWANTIQVLLRDSALRKQMGQAARRIIETEWPSWKNVLAEDLIPVWQKVTNTDRKK